MARGGFAICGSAKSEREAASCENKRAYGSRRAPGELSLEGRVEGSAPHPSLKGQSERKEAHSVSSFRCSTMVRFPGYPQFCLYIFASSYMVMCVDMLSYMFLCDLKPSTISLNIPPDSVVWVPMMVRIDVQSLRMQFIRAMGR